MCGNQANGNTEALSLTHQNGQGLSKHKPNWGAQGQDTMSGCKDTWYTVPFYSQNTIDETIGTKPSLSKG